MFIIFIFILKKRERGDDVRERDAPCLHSLFLTLLLLGAAPPRHDSFLLSCYITTVTESRPGLVGWLVGVVLDLELRVFKFKFLVIKFLRTHSFPLYLTALPDLDHHPNRIYANFVVALHLNDNNIAHTYIHINHT